MTEADNSAKPTDSQHSHETSIEQGFERRLFAEPSDKSVRIWRFMDFTKFFAILHRSGLFFARCDLLDDKFEGSVPRAMREETEGRNSRDEIVAYSDFNKWIRKWTTINCWHMNECESAAMWKLYAQSNEAIAVVSTYERLRNSLTADRFWIEQVQYIDYEKDRIPQGNAMYPVVFKRQSFAHENELRAFTSEFPTKGEHRLDMDREPSSPGAWEPVELDHLIETIHVAPQSPSWFVELVSEVSNKYNLRAPVKQSSLDLDPVY
jgi:hypothetical protein